MGTEELLDQKVIVPVEGEPFSYRLIPKRKAQVDKNYLAKLDEPQTREE